METIRVHLGPRSYEIRLVHDASHDLGGFARQIVPASRLALLVCDGNVTNHLARARESLVDAGFRCEVAVLPAGEPTKSLVHLSQLYDVLVEMPADRKTLVVAIGGGVIGDLAGYAAASYNRGLPLLMVPTTLLSMVDSSVGGKTGINHARGKNLIGAFHQPSGVWIDSATLNSLPGREYWSGLAEVVKYGVILDAEFFAWLEKNVDAIQNRDTHALHYLIQRTCRLKADVVEQDEREETGLRAVLNYGHTFAHAFETVGGYGGWLHGEAVAAGMVCASRLAERLGRISPELTQRQISMLQKFHLPVRPKPEWNIDQQIEVMRRDKKASAGQLRFVLPTRLGHVELVDGVPEQLVREVLTQS